MISFKEIN